MPTQQPDIAGRDDDDEEGGGIDLDRIKQLAGFFVRAARRRPKIASLTLLIGVVVVGFLAAYLPRTYTVDVRFLAQRNLMLPALDNPGANIPQDSGSLTRDVADTIKRRDNMIDLARQVDLLARWKATRPAVLRFKDKMMAAINGPTSDDDALKGLIVTLEQKLEVTVDASSVTISVDWPERQIAFDMVSTLSQNFVEARYDSEIAVINEAIEILERRAKEQGTNVDAALADIVKLEALRRAKATAPPPLPDPAPGAPPGAAPPPRPAAPPPVAPPSAASDDSSDDVARLAQVRRNLGELETEQKRKVADAERQLDDARVTLGPMHPTVVALAQKIDALKQPSADIVALRAEERQILARLSTYTRTDPGTPSPAPVPQLRSTVGLGGGGTSRPTPRAAATVPLPELSSQEDPQLYAARSKLATATSSYSELLRRIESAQIELDVARASFKYQYITVRPPELPTKPRKPNVPALVIGGLLATILLALGLAGIADLMSGRILEPWQVEHRLKLTILGELPPPKN
jgi:uncharacterized protein involved in exopolysaccharide biosynthesis